MTKTDKRKLVVTYKDSVADVRLTRCTSGITCKRRNKLHHVGIEILEFDTEAESIKAKAQLEKANNNIAAVEFDIEGHLAADVDTVNDPIFANIWSLHPNPSIPNDQFHVSKLVNMKLPSTNRDVIIALLDDCIYTKHPDLAGKLVDGYNTLEGKLESQGGTMWEAGNLSINHGTLTTGVAVAKSNNGIGGASIGGMFPNVKALPIRVSRVDGTLPSSLFVAGINHAISRNVDVISMSIAFESEFFGLATALNKAHTAGIALFAARGNNYDDKLFYPACSSNVNAIANTKKDMILTPSSSWGGISYVGNGTNVVRLLNDDTTTTTTGGGTSSACPHVASIYAACKAVNPLISREHILSIMNSYAFKSADTNKYGKGYPCAVKSIRVARAISAEMTEMPQLFDQPLNKVWTVTLNMDVDPTTLKGVVLIRNEDGNEHPITVKVNPSNIKQIIVTPTKNYNPGETYVLVVADVLNTAGGKMPKGSILIFHTI